MKNRHKDLELTHQFPELLELSKKCYDFEMKKLFDKVDEGTLKKMSCGKVTGGGA